MRSRLLLLLLGLVVLAAFALWLPGLLEDTDEPLRRDASVTREGGVEEAPSLVGHASPGVGQSPHTDVQGAPLDPHGLPTCAVTGTLRDAETGEPIPDAVVNLVPQRLGVIVEGRPILEGRSDAEGRFRIEGALPGHWVIHPRHPLYVPPLFDAYYRADAKKERWPASLFVVVPGADAAARHRDLELVRGPLLQGRVVDEAGQPVPYAEIHARRLPFVGLAYRHDVMAIGQLARKPVGRADAAGRFTISCVPPGVEEIRLGACNDAHAGLWSDALSLTPSRTHTDLVLRVERTAAVSGRVRFDDGGAVEGAELTASAERAWTRRSRALSGVDGVFHLPVVPAGPISVLARIENPVERHAQSDEFTLPPGGARSDLEIVLERGRPTRGVLRDAAGRPLEGEELEAVDSSAGDDEFGDFHERADTDADGRFVFDVRPDAEMDVVLTRPYGGEVIARGIRTPKEDLQLVAEATPHHVFEVRVLLPDGSPLPFFIAGLSAGDLYTHRKSGSVQGKAGRALVEIRSAPTIFLYVIECRDADGRALPYDRIDRTFEEAPPDVVEIRLRARGEVCGIVTDASGAPLEGVAVEVRNGDDELTLTTDPDGTFRQGEIRADLETVPVSVPRPTGYCPVRSQKAVPGGDPVHFVLRRGGRIEGRVTSPVEVDLSDARILATWEPRLPDEGASVWATIGADRSFVVDGVPPGREITLRLDPGWAASKRGLYPVRKTVARAGATDVVLALAQGLSIEGVVKMREGLLADEFGLAVYAVPEPGDIRWSDLPELEGDAVPFSLVGLRPGRYRVRVEYETHLLVQVEDVAAGTRGLEIELPELTSIEGRVLGLPEGETAQVVARLRGAEDVEDRDWGDLTDEDGTFAVHNVPAGACWIVCAEVGDENLIGVTEEVRAGQQDVRIQLREGLSIEGRIRRVDGSPPPVRILKAIGRGHCASITSNPDGSFRLAPLLPGTVRVTHSAAEPFAKTRAIEGVEAGTRNLEIVLP